MIVEKESEIKVLKSLCEEPFKYFSVAEICKKTNLSRNWIYKIIRKFENYDILLKSEKRYRLNFSNLFCKRFKLLIDSEFVNSLNEETRESIFNLMNRIVYDLKPVSVVLVGSTALKKMRKGSDLDFLVIGRRKEIPVIENANIVTVTKKEFEEKHMKGDDFVVSALAFGKILYDHEFFINFYEKPMPVFSQELIQEKIRYCEKLENRIYALLRSDTEKAREELLYLALQVARIILLKNRIVPGVKYDIPLQVKEFNEDVSRIVQELVDGKKIGKERILEYMRKCMTAIV